MRRTDGHGIRLTTGRAKTVGTNERAVFTTASFERGLFSFRFLFFSVPRSSCTEQAGLDTVVVVVFLLSSPFLLFSDERVFAWGEGHSPECSHLFSFYICSSLTPVNIDPRFPADAPLKTPTLLPDIPKLIGLTSCCIPLSVGVSFSFCRRRNCSPSCPRDTPTCHHNPVLCLFQTSLAFFCFCPTVLFHSPHSTYDHASHAAECPCSTESSPPLCDTLRESV